MKTLLTTNIRAALLLPLALLLTLAPATSNSAVAAPGYAYYWSLTFDYENNFNGVLRVDVGYAENGGVQNPPLYGENFNVTCQRVGNVSVGGGKATFNGGYLSCALDVKTALEQTLQTCYEKGLGCAMRIENVETYRSFRMLANVTSTAAGTAPLFYHKDASYTLTPAISDAQVAATLTPLGTLQSPALPAALGVAQNYAASYLCGVGCAMHFAIGDVQASLPQANAPVAFSTPLSTIYIGYNPATHTTVPVGTQIAQLYIDPPNLGNN